MSTGHCSTVLSAIMIPLLAASSHAGHKDTDVLYEESFSMPSALSAWHKGMSASESSEKGELTSLFLEKGGPDGKSGAVKFSVPGKGSSLIALELDPGKINGLIAFQADVRGEGLVRGEKGYLGPKFMLVAKTETKSHYPEPMREFGTYDWKTVRKVFEVPAKTESLSLVVGIQQGGGTFYVSNIKISRVTEADDIQVSDSELQALHQKAQTVPAGPHTGTEYRGVMSGGDLSPEAFAELEKWNVNLMRYQLGPSRARRLGFEGDVSTREGYLEWIDFEIERLDEVLKLAETHGVKIAIDLHAGHGTGISEVSSNILAESTGLKVMVEAWQKLAEHYKGNPRIYGYDLLNEPVPEKFLSQTEDPWKHMAQTMADAIREIDKETPIIVAWHQGWMSEIEGSNIIYTPHFYSPHSLTHQGLHQKNVQWSYPGEIDAMYWNKDQLRLRLRRIIEYQKKHDVKIFIGEFSCIAWAGGRAQYIKDCIELFEEYGWDWTYHAFREYPGWSAEHEGDGFRKLKPSADNPTKRVLLDAFQKNRGR